MIYLFSPARFQDDRGWFSETYNARKAASHGLDMVFVQDNQSFSRDAGTIRGLHFQAAPVAQGKLVRVLTGRILDVAVDIRRGSPTYGQYVSAELSAENGAQLYIPPGFAHAFATLEPNTQVFYKVTAFYDKASEGGVRWDDPDIGIDWGLGDLTPTLSAKDALLPTLSSFTSPFDYDGVPMTLTTLSPY
ncbi:dTDP-4-dehydrorhamnose 3,5-epimerase [Ancylobacter crimeensis]|uniref:dTDP-4-dehydrorhamnose 3,5-epimerase n=1 Tax=Ancylobacter crimeensis TaxID=2579147 RepID=UPI003CCFECDD